MTQNVQLGYVRSSFTGTQVTPFFKLWSHEKAGSAQPGSSAHPLHNGVALASVEKHSLGLTDETVSASHCSLLRWHEMNHAEFAIPRFDPRCLLYCLAP